MDKFNRLDQVAYIPMHANGDIEHSDVQFGFVTSDGGKDVVFVRYWRKGENGRALRTTSCSECTPRYALVQHNSATEGEVKRAWKGVQE